MQQTNLVVMAARLDETVAALSAFTRALPPEALASGSADRWGPKQVFTHIVFWQEQYAGILQALVNGETPALLRGTFKGNNALAVAQYGDCTVDELIARLSAAQARLLARVDARTQLAFPFKEGGKV